MWWEWLFGRTRSHSYEVGQWVKCKDKKNVVKYGQVTSTKPIKVSAAVGGEATNEWEVIEPVDQDTASALQHSKENGVELQETIRKLEKAEADLAAQAKKLQIEEKERRAREAEEKATHLMEDKEKNQWYKSPIFIAITVIVVIIVIVSIVVAASAKNIEVLVEARFPTTPPGPCNMQQTRHDCAPGYCWKNGACMCIPNDEQDGPKTCRKSDKNHNMTFYVYTVQGDDANTPAFPSHADVGIVTYSLQGVMWHLHNRIVTKSCPRGQKVTRIQRYKAIVYNTDVPYTRWGGQFGPFMNYSQNGEGICKGPEGQEGHCGSLYSKYGNVVGCLSWQPYMGGTSYGNATHMYSLPGMRSLSDSKSGWCESPDGQNTCTWNLTRAGEVTLDQLANITDYNAFCAAGHFEYDSTLDRGNGSSFWDGRGNSTANDARAVKLHKLFLKLFPNKEFPFGLPEPVCDGQNAECAYIDACRKTGLSGNCCPTDNGNSLECCPRRINQQVFQQHVVM